MKMLSFTNYLIRFCSVHTLLALVVYCHYYVFDNNWLNWISLFFIFSFFIYFYIRPDLVILWYGFIKDLHKE